LDDAVTRAVLAEAQARFNAEIQARLRTSTWVRGGCNSWYLNERGENVTLWPGSTIEFRRRTRHLRSADVEIIGG